MDPHNGEILAMASSPRMDLNNYSNYFSLYDDGSQYNRSIGMSYEPGSVFKVLTMAAALDTGTVRPETTFVDIGGDRCWRDHHPQLIREPWANRR